MLIQINIPFCKGFIFDGGRSICISVTVALQIETTTLVMGTQDLTILSSHKRPLICYICQ